MKTNRKRVARLAIFMLIVAMIAGCSGKGSGAEKPAGEKGKEGTGVAASGETGYPGQLTYWVSLNGNASATMQDMNGIAAYQELEKTTGTKVKFQHPPAGQEADAFNIMVSSGNLPDVVEYGWANVSGGPDKAISDGSIIRLNELIEEHAPNVSKLLNEHPEYKKLITTDGGNIYVFPFIRGDEYLLTFNGLIIRQDWLDQLKLSVPETIDEWYEVLKAFKTKDPNGNGQADEIPLLLDMDMTAINHAFVGAWGITTGFYQVDGNVKYGPIQPEFKSYLETMSKWYAEGLIDQDYAATDSTLKDAKVTNNQVGAFSGYMGSSLGRYSELMLKSNPNVDLVGAPNVVLKKGDTPILGQKDSPFNGFGAAITKANKFPAETVKWLDYKYGEEGHMLFNFGVEGVSYDMKDGYPTYTDEVMKNPDGLSITQALSKYNLASYSGPFVQDRRYIEQYSALPQQKAAIETWMKAENDRLMPIISPTAEESTRYASIMNDINTYYEEMVNKFIMGVEPISGFDQFVQTVQGMGIEEALQIQQAALDRFNSR
ncbi:MULTISPECIES: extracellular solute-binding protein [Paenibacillus]|uniref:ABC transporter substrate-binding protein n=1 Tax=Paenibacillus lautus TaxID=1401 RepID=A0A1R1B9S1_PAELA|nr:extracellular solute-binding protein [Paenibacillus lautus]OME96883.1 ABC transporter substrate-binding protein [Paenibacillus lautus]